MHATDLKLEPNEASDLCPVLAPDLLEEQGWDRAFLTALDEVPIECGLALLGHHAEQPAGEGWEGVKLEAKPSSGAGKTEDAESCARRQDGFIYVLGSQFGAKDGPLEPARSWVARLREDDLADAAEGDKLPLELVRLRFALHRAVNDALAEAAIDLIELGPESREAYIDATIARGAKKDKRWAGTVRSGDQPINVEGADFRPDGRLLLGLRYPVSAEGEPLLVELEDVDALFDEDGDPEPSCGPVWVLDGAGSRDAPAGVRALHSEGDDSFEVMVGNLDSAGKGATVLADHPEGAEAISEHLRFSLPLKAAGGPVKAEPLHAFEDVRRVEGVALGPDGRAHYVIDEDGRVELRTLVLGGA